MGPKIVTADVVSDPHNLAIRLTLNGQIMQDSNTNQLIFGVPELIEFLSQTITLEPGFTRDVSNIGHYGTGDLEITLGTPDDLDRAKPLIQRSYDAS